MRVNFIEEASVYMHFDIFFYNLQTLTFKFTGKSKETKILNDLPADVLTEY
jgi:hypothetical protein